MDLSELTFWIDACISLERQRADAIKAGSGRG